MSNLPAKAFLAEFGGAFSMDGRSSVYSNRNDRPQRAVAVVFARVPCVPDPLSLAKTSL